ncbi:hypothetical protein GCWU000246_00100 [Jonquetella anthropi E3_33 E1]|nr:hypothetical protein GCWU000246_00100 [Jonquetella anthropi E3_33 E1]
MKSLIDNYSYFTRRLGVSSPVQWRSGDKGKAKKGITALFCNLFDSGVYCYTNKI